MLMDGIVRYDFVFALPVEFHEAGALDNSSPGSNPEEEDVLSECASCTLFSQQRNV